jgi:uncharacterized protein with HEPN domain
MKDDKVYLVHIADAVGEIRAYTAGGRDEFMTNRMVQDAVLRNFEIIGEATKHLSDALKRKRPDIAWRDVAGFRDVLIHDYMGVDLEEVWSVIGSSLPPLREAVEKTLAD